MSTRYSNVSDVPLALAVFLASDYYDYNEDPDTISATTLLKPLRQIVLPPRIPAGSGLVDLTSMMSNRKGAAVHDAIERAWLTNYKPAMMALGYPKGLIDRIVINPKPEELTPRMIPVYLEQRLTRQVGRWKVTGKFDFVGEGRVQDFKTASVWSYMQQVNFIKQQLQGSLYRWLDSKMITQDEMDIHHIFMDWKGAMVRSDPKYPPKPFMTQKIKLLTEAATNQFVTEKLNGIDRYWNAPEEDLPLCTGEDLWRSETVFKYYKNPTKTTRSTKNFDSRAEASLRLVEDGNVGVVIEKPGRVMACHYCPAFGACGQKDDLIRAGELIMN